MNPIPLPSHVHYELLLQLLERQTLFALGPHSAQREQTNQLIATLRKAFAQQKRLEESCRYANIPVESRWSTHRPLEQESTSNVMIRDSQPPS